MIEPSTTPNRDGSPSSADGDFLRSYLRYALRWWVQLLLAASSLAATVPFIGAWSTALAMAFVTYLSFLAFGLYAYIGWLILWRGLVVPLTASVAFISVCSSLALAVEFIVVPSPFQPIWWVALATPILTFPLHWLFFKMLSAISRVNLWILGRRR